MNKKVAFLVLSCITILIPIGYLLGIISAKVAYPMVFILLGCQQLFRGLFIEPAQNKKTKMFSIVVGIGIIIFGVFIVIPTYYF